MKDEAEIMDEIYGLNSELKNFPPKAHWFCPRRHDEDYIDYDHPDEPDEDMSTDTKNEMIKDAKHRHEVACKLSIITGLDHEASGEMLNEYTRRLNRLLQTCDKCVRNWHMGRKPYLKYLAESFDEDTVTELSNRLNTIDFHRVDEGLSAAEKTLMETEEGKRSQAVLVAKSPKALMALFEALCCVEYHISEENLARHFNYVFEQIQSRKVLRIGDILPAMARFLFDSNPKRLLFAQSAWQRTQVALTATSFEWVVHDALSAAISKVSHPLADLPTVLNFWNGFLLLLGNMDEDLIKHSLRAMEVQPSIYQLLVTHLRSSSDEVLALVVEAFRALLTISPTSFWSAMGTISPVTVAEQIFASQGFETLLLQLRNSELAETSPAISWIPGFVESLPAIQQFDACRSLHFQLFERLQDERFPQAARLACCRAGLHALSRALNTFLSPDYKINPSTSLLVINDIMGLVSKYEDTIVGLANIREDAEDAEDYRELKLMARIVIRDALALDCKTMRSEYQALSKGEQIQRVERTNSQSVWALVLERFNLGDIEMAKTILAATGPLTGIDELLPPNKKYPLDMHRDHLQFNKDFKQLNNRVATVFERLSDFSSSHLRQLYQAPQTARPLFSALVSADQGTYEAAVAVIKAMTGESSKQDALKNILEDAFTIFLNAITFAVNRITNAKIFSPVPYMLKIGRDILEALCGNTGVLRTRTVLSSSEQSSIVSWWSSQWRALHAICSEFEKWSHRVARPKDFMPELIRDAMEYSNALFDQHTILASALREPTPEINDKSSHKSVSQKESIKRILDVVCPNILGLTNMIRLRDQYLISIITRLLAKLLRCLGEYDLEIDQESSDFISGACKRDGDLGYKRTNLTNAQKAELQRALDDNLGAVEIIETRAVGPSTATKQLTIDSWSRSSDGKKHEPTFPPKKSVAKPVKFENSKSKSKLGKVDFERRRLEEEERNRNKAKFAADAKAIRTGAMVKGEGSGLQGIGGIVGKDHAPPRSEIMIGSSDEEDSDDEDSDEANALITRRKETSKQVAEYDESRRRAFLQQGPVKKTKIQRSAKDLRARVEPNMDKLYLEILNWNFFHGGESPPSNNLDYVRIDNKYLDLDRYKHTFGPLLLSEVWRSLVTAKEEMTSKRPVEIKVLNRMSVDKFMEISTSMPLSTNQDSRMAERDIVLLSRSLDPLNEHQEPHCLARIDRTTRKKDTLEVTYRVSRDVDPSFLQCLVPNGRVNVLKIADMTTTQREFAALSSLEYYDLCNEVLEAKPSPIQKYGEEKLSSMSSKYNLNRGQAKAILSANDNDGFTLIQGPPGSGKTKTIIAMVGALLTPSLQQQQENRAQSQQLQRPGGAKPAAAPPKKKLLICAPSNAAVDELVVRLKEGIQPLNGPRQKINVIRIGRSDAINASVKDVMLDELVRVKMEGTSGEKDKIIQDRDKLHQEAAKIKERLNVVRPAMDAARASSNKAEELKLQKEFDELKRAQARIGNRIDEDKESGNTISRTNEINRRRFQQEIIDGAHVLCATLSGSGHDMFRNLNVEFETVIIDEAAQCIELSALIPLKYGCSKCILVGDPEQLPPTVLSRSAQSFGYEQSLFVRMQKNHPKDVHLLDTQYRMHPEISFFPSQQFYHSRLIDGDGMAKLRQQPWHASSILGPYRFFDVEGVQTKQARGHSIINVPELNAALALYARLKADYQNCDFRGKIGIITTYKGQLIEMKNRFQRQYGDAVFDDIEFNTTDAFQGREREIIIFSCVRAQATGGIGFLSDIRRMNVGLTRAKSSLWVLGDARALRQGEFWNKLIEDAKARDRFTGGDVMRLFSKPTSLDAQHGQSSYSSPSALLGAESTRSVPSPQVIEDEDDDVEMVDAPITTSNSQESSYVGTTAEPVDTGNKELREPSIDRDRGMAALGINKHGKRPWEQVRDDMTEPLKKAMSSEPSALEAAYRAQQAAPKPPTPSMRPPPLGLPKKKAPADPFIQRKKPQRRT